MSTETNVSRQETLPLVSIVTPAYNCEKFVRQTVDSVLAQTYENWEMWIVDDASTDSTRDILEQIREEGDPRIHIYRNPQNSGAALSRNYALRKATGDFIAFLDGDDSWDPRKLERQLAFMEREGIDFSYTDYDLIDASGNEQGIRVSGPTKVTRRGMFRYCWPGCLTVMYRRSAIGLIQIPDLAKRNDYAMWLRAIKKADCHLLPEVLAHYRKGHAGSLSSGGFQRLIKHHYRLFRLSEQQNSVHATLSTMRNLFWGPYKKKRYVRRVR